MPQPPRAPITVALVDDYDVVLTGVANMFEPVPRPGPGRRDRRQRAASKTPSTSSCTTRSPSPSPTTTRSRCWSTIPRARRVVVYTWNFHPELVESARQQGRTATCPRRCPRASWSRPWRRCTPARWSSARPPARARGAPGLDWPGRGEGLTDRESEILALITQGKSNAEVARLTYLSPNTVKSYIRTIYRKIGRRQPHPGGALGRQPRLHPGPPPHRPLARRPLELSRATKRVTPAAWI